MPTTRESIDPKKLSAKDRIELIGALWDSLTIEEVVENLPGWHLEEIQARCKLADENPQCDIPWDEAKSQLLRGE